jgi:hypothetical protein
MSNNNWMSQLQYYLDNKDTLFSIEKNQTPGSFDVDYNFEKFKELFDFFQSTFGVIKIPKGTLIFHSNQFSSDSLNTLEPLGTSMKIQDIRKYGNKKFDVFKYPFSQMNSRIYVNFTPAGNMFVTGNYSVAESVYAATEDIFMFQLPYIDGIGHLKDIFDLSLSRIFREYIDYRIKTDNIKYCGFVLSTEVDKTHIIDENATRIRGPSYGYVVYPEILLLDGFDKFVKKMQYDLYSVPYSVPSIITPLIDSRQADTHIPRIDINTQKTNIANETKCEVLRIGKFGMADLYAYVIP